jgi:hypothetical protein
MSAPTATVEVVVVLSTRFIPNCPVPLVPAAAEAIAGMVFAPDDSVVPFTVMAYPEPAFLQPAICDVAVAESTGEKSWLNAIVPAVVVVQFALTVAPVQKIKDSGMIPVSTIGSAVLAVTVPVSIGLPVVSVLA